MPAEPPKKSSPPPPSLLARHWAAFKYALGVLIPTILRTGRRPVIFSRGTGMGDIICTIPAALELRKRHPNSYFIYNCHRDFITIPRVAGIADRITSLGPIGLIGHWYGWLTGGFYHFAHGDDLPGMIAQEPMVAEFRRQFSLPINDTHPQLTPGPAAVEKVRNLFREKKLDAAPLILIHPGPTWPIKEWPREQWTQLLAALRERGHANVAQLGVGRYMNFGKVAVEPIPGAVSLVDELSVEECIAAIGRARLFIGVDSGLLHIAAATRTPSVGIWGSTSPQFFYAENVRRDFVVSQVPCQGCYHRRPRVDWVTGCPNDIICLRTMPVEPVLEACLAKLTPVANS